MEKLEALEITCKIAKECNGKANCEGCPFNDKERGCLVYFSVNDHDSATIIEKLLSSYCGKTEEVQRFISALEDVIAQKDNLGPLFFNTIPAINYEEFAKKVQKEFQDNKQDNINHPKHYLKGGMEGIDVIKAAVSNLSGFEAVCVANIIKYVWRYKEKNGLEDLQKAAKYLEWLQEEVQKNEKG